MSRPGAHSPSPKRGDEGDHGEAAPAVSRRRFLGWTAAGVAGAAAATFGVVEGVGRHTPDRLAAAVGRPVRPTPVPGPGVTVLDGVSLPTNPVIVAENARPGAAWWVTTPQRAGDMEGYSDHVSAAVGDTVTLYVNTKATTFHVDAFRMGYYQGIGARRVWQSAETPGVRQALPELLAPTNTIECSWTPSLSFVVDRTWPPGAYLLKLVGATSEQGFVPLCVRDDASEAALVIQHAVATWQAYNRWGGYSLYYGNRGGALSFTHNPGGGTYADRARIVSYDRPYDHDWASGAADFVGNEFPVVFHAERLGLDVTYWTDLDLHARPELVGRHRGLVSLGHDEYWSAPMRYAAQAGVAGGLNLAFLGANACYRQIRLEPSPLGPDRHEVCYKSAAEDPMTGHDDALVTVNWAQPPVNDPEASLIGSTYQDIGAQADMVVADASHWTLAGTGLTDGQHLPQAVRGEFDRYVPGGANPPDTDVVAHSLVANRRDNYSDVTWYTAPAGGGVFATGDASWVGQLADAPLIPSNVLAPAEPAVTPHLLRIMENVYSVIGAGPASITHPSTGTWRAVYTPGSTSSRAPTSGSAS